MKKFLILFVIVNGLTSPIVYGQFDRVDIDFKMPDTKMQLHNINSVFVVDARPDTVAIGIMQKNSDNNTFVMCGESLKSRMNQFNKQYFQFATNDSSGTLMMVFRKFWLTDELSISDKDYINENIKNAKSKYTSGIMAQIEFYLKKNDDYYPLYKFDSTLNDSSTIKKHGSEYVYESIIASFSKLQYMDVKISNLAGKRKLSYEDILAHLNSPFNIKILTDTMLQAGVYKTFEEFKKNSPAEKNFRVRNEKANDIIYIKEADGKEYVDRNNWGYCDGKRIYIRSADNYFELLRKNKAFYAYGAKSLTRKKGQGFPIIPSDALLGPALTEVRAGGAVIFDQFNHNHIKLTLELLMLDMETGILE